MKKLLNILIFIGGIITVPFWVLCLIVIVLNSCENINMVGIDPSKTIIIGDSLVSGNDWEIDSYGIPGSQINYMIDNFIDISKYDNVFILLGVNNLAVSNTPEFTKLEMNRLISFIGNKNIYIISLLPLDNDRKPFPTNELVLRTNLLYKNYPNFINVYDSMIYRLDVFKDDGIHLNEIGNEILESVIYQYINF